MAVLKSTEHDITLTSFVADLSYPGLSNFYIICEIDAKNGAESLALIFALVKEISEANEREAPRRRILLLSTVYAGCPKIDGSLARVTYCPRPHRALRQNCHVGLLRGEVLKGTAASATRHRTENMPLTAQRLKFRLDMSQDIFQKDEALVHPAAKTKR